MVVATHFTNIIFSEEDIPGSKVSVDEALVTEVVHTTSNITSKSQQQLRNMLSNRFTISMVQRSISYSLLKHMNLPWFNRLQEIQKISLR